jgi:hypothetical protein
MKQMLITMLLPCLYLGFAGCQKKEAAPSILGKWLILNDSTKITGRDSFPSSHSNFIGTASDYYDFRSDGKLYVKEDDYLDTMAYEVTGNNQVGCAPSPGFNTSYNISHITSSQATLIVDGFMSSGELMKIINLKR